jgi:SAM-dependent methyltransferase
MKAEDPKKRERVVAAHPAYKDVPCALCGGSDVRSLVNLGRGVQIVRCCHDGLVFVSPRYSEDDLVNSFHDYVGEGTKPILAKRLRTLEREAEVIKRFRGSGSLLDVGCANGHLFAYFPEAEWRRCGVELSRAGVEEARRCYNADVFCGELRHAPWAAESFDVVTILDSLYYFHDPVGALQVVHRLLRPDGILAVEIPGFFYKSIRERGPLCWLKDRKWTRIDPECKHVYHFSPRTLRCLVQKAGFKTIRLIPEQSPEQCGWLAEAATSTYFTLSQLLPRLTAERISIAAKELYICEKIPGSF